jgi:murein DD-endopeptidase MepM/ murein hydrolase activator NlpD
MSKYNNVIIKKSYYIISTFIFGFFLIFNGNQPFSMELQSDPIQGGLVYGTISDGETIYIGERTLSTDKEGRFLFALSEDAPDAVTITVENKGQKTLVPFAVRPRSWREEVVNGLPSEKVSPSPENLKRIEKESALLFKERQKETTVFFPVCFQRPVTDYTRISSDFGSKRVLNGVKTKGHSGTDYAAPTGTPVYAPAPGVVKIVHEDMFYSGKTILIDHGFGLYSSYSHLNEITIKQNDAIQAGDKIGSIGTTGNSTGPHLHLTFTWFHTRLDPEHTLLTYPCPK